jgi:hypothetical protein
MMIRIDFTIMYDSAVNHGRFVETLPGYNESGRVSWITVETHGRASLPMKSEMILDMLAGVA